MKRSVTLILIVGLLGLGTLSIVPAALAQHSGSGSSSSSSTDTSTTDTSTSNTNTATTPEIDVGAAAGALTIIGGALALLGERLRRK